MVKEIVARLKLDSKEFLSGISSAEKSVLTFSLSVSAVSAVVMAAAKKTVEFETGVAKLSRVAGSTVEEFSKLSYAAGRSGIETENLAKHMRKINDPSKEATDELKRLGISLTDTAGRYKTQSGLLGELADKFKGMKTPIQAAQSSLAIFGEEGSEMVHLLRKGSDGIKELSTEAEKLGFVITKEIADEAARFKGDMKGIGALIDGLTMSVSNSVIALVNQSGVFQSIQGILRKVAEGWKNLDESTKSFIVTVGGILAGISALTISFAGLSAVMPYVISGISAMIGGVSVLSVALSGGIVALAILAAAAIKYIDQIKESVEPLLELVSELKDGFVENIRSIKDSLAGFSDSMGLEHITGKFREWLDLTDQEGEEISVLGTIANGIFKMISTNIIIMITPFQILYDIIVNTVDAIRSLGTAAHAAITGDFKKAGEEAQASWGSLKQMATDVKERVVDAGQRIKEVWTSPLFVSIDISDAKKKTEDLEQRIRNTKAAIGKEYKSIATELKETIDAVSKAIKDNLYVSWAIAGDKIQAVTKRIAEALSQVTSIFKGIVENINEGMKRTLDDGLRSLQIRATRFTESMEAEKKAVEEAADSQKDYLSASYDKQISDLEEAENRKLDIIENAASERLLSLNAEYLEAKRLQEEAFAAYMATELEKYEAEKALLLEKAVDKEERQLTDQMMDEDWKAYAALKEEEQKAKLEEIQKSFTENSKGLDEKKKAEKLQTEQASKVEIEKLTKEKNDKLQALEVEKNAKLEAIEKEKQESEKKLKRDEAMMKWKAETAMLENMKPIRIAEVMTQAMASAAMVFATMTGMLGPVGTGIGAALAALIMANAAYAVSNIISQRAPQPVELSLGTGGVLRGPSHEAGGIAARLEGGEGVIDRVRTEKLISAVDGGTNRGINITFSPGAIQNNGNALDESFLDKLSAMISRRLEREGFAV